MRRLSGAVRSLLLALCVTAPMAGAQQPCGPDDFVPWLPRWNQGAPAGVKPAERVAMEATQAAVEAIVKQTNYGRPRGFALRNNGLYATDPPTNEIRTYGYSAFSFIRCNKYDEHGADILVTFNPRPDSWSEGGPMADESGDGLFVERPRSTTQFGSTVTFGAFHKENSLGLFVLFVANGASPTIPVSREAYLKARMFSAEGSNGAKIADASTAVARKYQEWLAGAAQRRKDREQMLTMLAAQDPSKVAPMRAELEKGEKEADEFFRQMVARERAEGGSALREGGNQIRAQLAAMTPQERASPAWVVGFDLVAAGTPGASAIVRVNPDFYRVRRNSVEVRAILVRMPNVQPEVRKQHEQLLREFDWDALKQLLVK